MGQWGVPHLKVKSVVVVWLHFKLLDLHKVVAGVSLEHGVPHQHVPAAVHVVQVLLLLSAAESGTVVHHPVPVNLSNY